MPSSSTAWAPLGFLEEHRRAAHLAEGAHRARHAGRDQRLSARVEFGRARERQSSESSTGLQPATAARMKESRCESSRVKDLAEVRCCARPSRARVAMPRYAWLPMTWQPKGVEQPPSMTRRNSRSQRVAFTQAGSASAAIWLSMAASSARHCAANAPCPGAGTHHSRRQLDQREGREIELQAGEARGGQHDGVDVLPFGEPAATASARCHATAPIWPAARSGLTRRRGAATTRRRARRPRAAAGHPRAARRTRAGSAASRPRWRAAGWCD